MSIIDHAGAKSPKKPHTFAQTAPKSKCPNEVWHLVESLHLGYLKRCWEPRCCWEGNANWSYKNSLCETRLFDYVDVEVRKYRGDLTMPEDSTPQQHIKTRRNFTQIVNRWRSERQCVLEMRGILDIDNETNAHWDILLYSNAPKKPLKGMLSEAWERSGGLRCSLSPCQLDRTIKYQNKDTLDPKRARKYLPASQSELGMDMVWSTRPGKTSKGFWAGQSRDSLWKEWLKEWHGERQSGGSSPTVVKDIRLKIIAKLKAATPDWEGYLQAFSWHASESLPVSGSLDELLEMTV